MYFNADWKSKRDNETKKTTALKQEVLLRTLTSRNIRAVCIMCDTENLHSF